MNLLSNETAGYSTIVYFLIVVMDFIPLYFIFRAIYRRKLKEDKRSCLCAAISILLAQMAMACVGGVIEQFYIAENMTSNVLLVILQTVMSFLLSAATYIFVVPKRKRNILMVILLTGTGFLAANYVSYLVMIVGLAADILLICHGLTALAVIVFTLAAYFVLKNGKTVEVVEKPEKKKNKKCLKFFARKQKDKKTSDEKSESLKTENEDSDEGKSEKAGETVEQ